jgi:hypothetical protein
MRKHHVEYDSLVDALVAVAKRLSHYEEQYRMACEEFFDRYSKGRLDDSVDFVEWANSWRHFLTIRSDLARRPSIVDAIAEARRSVE